MKPVAVLVTRLEDKKVLKNREFVCRLFFVDWHQISLGVSIDLLMPNIELHIPFGFFKFGFEPAPWKSDPNYPMVQK